MTPVHDFDAKKIQKIYDLNVELQTILERSEITTVDTYFVPCRAPRPLNSGDVFVDDIICDVLAIRYGDHGLMITNIAHWKAEIGVLRKSTNPLRRLAKIYHHRYHEWNEAGSLFCHYMISRNTRKELIEAYDEFKDSFMAENDDVSTMVAKAVEKATLMFNKYQL